MASRCCERQGPFNRVGVTTCVRGLLARKSLDRGLEFAADGGQGRPRRGPRPEGGSTGVRKRTRLPGGREARAHRALGRRSPPYLALSSMWPPHWSGPAMFVLGFLVF